jgi:hypothetical protein
VRADPCRTDSAPAAMEPEPEPDHGGSDDSSGCDWEDDYESETEQADEVEREPVLQPAVVAAPAQRKVKGRGARRFEMHESAYELGHDRLGRGTGPGDAAEGRGDRQPHVLEVVMSRGMESSMLVLQQLEEVARQCSSAGVDTAVELQWFPADRGTGALAVFRSATAANTVLRQVESGASGLFTLVAYDDASETARSIPVEHLGRTTRQATTSTAATRMLTSALGLRVRLHCCVSRCLSLHGRASLISDNTDSMQSTDLTKDVASSGTSWADRACARRQHFGLRRVGEAAASEGTNSAPRSCAGLSLVSGLPQGLENPTPKPLVST